MANVYKKVEVVGTDTSLQGAIERAIKFASTKQTEGDELDWFEVKGVRGHIDRGKITHFQVEVLIGYRVPHEA